MTYKKDMKAAGKDFKTTIYKSSFILLDVLLASFMLLFFTSKYIGVWSYVIIKGNIRNWKRNWRTK